MKKRILLFMLTLVFSKVLFSETAVLKSRIRIPNHNDTRVRLRSEPNLESETLEYLNTGDKVKITDRSMDKQKIADMEAYWYKVETEGGLVGWTYGAFVDVE